MGERPAFLSAFAGVGGFDLGLERAGWRCAGQIEIDRFATKVLERHWPHVRRWRDIRDVTFPDAAGEQPPLGDGVGAAQRAGRPEQSGRPGLRSGHGGADGGAADLQPGAIDLLCGGFPCQDLSVAGRRAGLAAPRSGLFFEFVRLARALRPRWLLLENVPGLLSSNGGRDFAVVLAALGDAGYGVGWRVLDARWFGVPQRRRRVFLVGRLGAPCPPEVLVEPEGVQRDLEAGGEAGAGLAGGVADGALGSGQRGLTFRNSGQSFRTVDDAGGTLSARDYKDTGQTVVSFDHTQDPVSSGEVVPTLNEDGQAVSIAATLSGGGSPNRNAPGRRKEDDQNFVVRLNNGSADPLVRSPDITDALARGSGHGGGNPTHGVQQGAAVRRLTPTECARLQGFPDDWNCLCGVEPYSTWTCRCPDGPRYASYGNAVCVPVVEWLGRRILAAE